MTFRRGLELTTDASEKHTKVIAKTESRASVCRMRRSRSIKCGLGLFLRSLCVCTVCVKINNDELFFNAFPFENSFYLISGYA